MTTIIPSPTASPISCTPTGAGLIIGPLGCATPGLASRRRTLPERLRSVALAIRRLLPAAGSSTPSSDAISSLSPSDRLGERY